MSSSEGHENSPQHLILSFHYQKYKITCFSESEKKQMLSCKPTQATPE